MNWLTTYPSTNARLFASVCLDVVYVLTALFCMVQRIDVDSNIIWALGTFLLVLSGLDATQFNIKRKTEIVTPPQAMAENTKTTTVTAPPVFTQADAQRAAALLEANQQKLNQGEAG